MKVTTQRYKERKTRAKERDTERTEEEVGWKNNSEKNKAKDEEGDFVTVDRTKAELIKEHFQKLIGSEFSHTI